MNNDETLEQFDRDAAQLLITLECSVGEAHWLMVKMVNSLKQVRKALEKQLSANNVTP